MDRDVRLADGALLAAIIFFAYAAQAVPGFGSSVLTVTLAALFLPLTALGLWLGDVIHDRVSESAFRVMLNVVLVASGAALVK
jgi:uncharacterized membrane protein YfcA